MKKCIINGELVLPDKTINGTLVIEDGIISDIIYNNEIPVDAEIIDAKGGFVLAGFIDTHVHGGGGFDKVVQALKEHNVHKIAKHLYNDFEVAMHDKKIIHKIKEEFKEHGAVGSLMTGSGSCVFGIFEDKETAELAYDALKDKYETYICTSYNALEE